MGGYFTWSRRELDAIQFRQSWYFSNPTVKFPVAQSAHGAHYWSPTYPPPAGYLDLPTQTTTSWRTSRGGVDSDDVSEASVDFTPSTEAGVFDYLKTIEAMDPPRNPYDTGHTFNTIKHWAGEMTHPAVTLASSVSGALYTGPLIPVSSALGVQWVDPPSASSLVSKYGPAAIAATAPVNPASTFGTGFYEALLDGLPSIPRELGNVGHGIWHTLRSIASGHLSYSFDWMPFISDLRSTVHALTNASKIIRQYARDSGRMVRRRMEFPVVRTVQSFSNPTATAVYSPPGINTAYGWRLDTSPNQSWFVLGKGTGVGTRETQELTTRVWFKGAYSYFLPVRKGALGKLEEYEEKANHLLGTELTPSLLWELAPWSWLVDWKTEIGNSIKNFTAFQTDGLVMRYGYLMVEQTMKHSVSVNTVVSPGGSVNRISPSVSYFSQRKERFRATPYGFGLDPSSFTAKQWSILGALGMTRSSTSLRVD